MPQVSLYVDEPLMQSLRKDAEAEGVSLSRFVAQRLQSDSRHATPSGLPEGLLDSLYGCLADDDSFVRPTQLDPSLDATRLAFDEV